MKKNKKNIFLNNLWKLDNSVFNTDSFSFYNKSFLFFDESYSHDIQKIIEKYKTPIKIFFPSILEKRIKNIFYNYDFLSKKYKYNGTFLYFYPLKANQSKEVILTALRSGANLEVSSSNELSFLKEILVNYKISNSDIKIICNGPKDSLYIEKIKDMTSSGFKVIPIVESIEESRFFSNHKDDIGVRLNISFSKKINFNRSVDHFGLSKNEIFKLLPKDFKLSILHYHLGSQIKDKKVIFEVFGKVLYIFFHLQKKYPSLDTIDIGGGLYPPYIKKRIYSDKDIFKGLIKILKNFCVFKKIKEPNLISEWGQYIVAPSQITIYSVSSEKKINKEKSWFLIDGSLINDLKDTWALRQKWHIVPINFESNNLKKVKISGRTCDSDDIYPLDNSFLKLPNISPEKSLYLIFLDTGAYQDALSSHHCLLSSPIKLMIEKGEVKIIKHREEIKDFEI